MTSPRRSCPHRSRRSSAATVPKWVAAVVCFAGGAWASCTAPGEDVGTRVGLLASSEFFSRVDHFRIQVFDAAVQRCAGDAVPDPSAAVVASSGRIGLGQTVRLEVSPGERTFYAEAYEDAAEAAVLGTGCTERSLAQGENARVIIRFAETAITDADADADGDADAGPDADAEEDVDVHTDADSFAEAEVEADGGPVVYYWTSFADVDCSTWTTGSVSGANDWECGAGSGDPGAGHDAPGGVLATRIGGNYSVRSDGFAQSPVIDAGGGSGPLRLLFWHWMEAEGRATDCTGSTGNNDGGLVAVSTGGGFATTGVAPSDGYPIASIDAWFSGGPAFVNGLPGFSCRSGSPLPPEPTVAWEQRCFDLTAFRSATLRLRCYFGSDSTAVARGWYIDEVVVEDGTCP